MAMEKQLKLHILESYRSLQLPYFGTLTEHSLRSVARACKLQINVEAGVVLLRPVHSIYLPSFDWLPALPCLTHDSPPLSTCTVASNHHSLPLMRDVADHSEHTFNCTFFSERTAASGSQRPYSEDVLQS